jgi:hypothetical protein
VHGGWHREVLGIDVRQLGGMGPEHIGQHVREILQQMQAVGHLARHGSPKTRRFRVCPGTIPHEPLNPRMRLQPLRHGGRLPVGKEGQGPTPCEVQQERALGMARAQGEIVHAEDVWGNHRGAWGVADHP